MLNLAHTAGRPSRLALVTSAVLVCGVVLPGSFACSPSAARQTQTQPQTDSPIAVKASQLFVTIENRAGMAVVDVDVRIVPVGKSAEFKKLISRLEATEERDYSLSEFRSNDGTPFSLRLARPKGIRISARDVGGKAYSVEVPWQ